MTQQTQQSDQNKVDVSYNYCLLHRLLNDRIGRSFSKDYQHGVCDPEIAAEFIKRMHQHQRKVARGEVPPFTTPELEHGELVIGHAWDRPDVIYRIPLSYLAGNTLVSGSSGSGKTVRAYFLALSVAMNKNAIWLVDLRKKEFRRLRGAFQRMGMRLICLDARKMKLNPLQPPLGVDPRNWAPQVADLLIQVLRLPPRTAKLTATLIHQLYTDGGVYTGSRHYPTLYCLLKTTHSSQNVNPQSRMALIDSLESLLASAGSIFNYHVGWTTHDLSQHCLAPELDGVGEVVKDLILNTMVLGEFFSRITRDAASPSQTELAISVDEANRLAAGSGGGQFGLSNLICVVRSTKIKLDLSCQTPDLDPQILANTATKYVGRTSHFPDMQSMGRAMGLSAEQVRFFLHNAQPGKFVVQLGEGEWRHPFLLQIPKMDLTALDRMNTDIDAEDLGPLDALPTVPRREPSGPITPGQSGHADDPPKSPETRFDSDAEAKVMKIIAEHPFIALRDLIAEAKMSSKTIAVHRKALTSKGYILQREIHRGGPGRATIHLEALPAGIDAVAEYFQQGGAK